MTQPTDLTELERQFQPQVNPALAILNLTVKALAERALVWFAAVSACGLFAWSLAVPDWRRITAAGVYTGLVFLPVLWRRKG